MTPTAIIAELDACTTKAEVEAVAKKHRSAVMALKQTDPARFAHCVNKKQHMIDGIKE